MNICLSKTEWRSTHRRCSVKKVVLRNFAQSTGKHLCQRLFFDKVAGLRPATLLKKSLCHRCFSVNCARFLRTPFLLNTSGRLPLNEELTLIKSYELVYQHFEVTFLLWWKSVFQGIIHLCFCNNVRTYAFVSGGQKC